MLFSHFSLHKSPLTYKPDDQLRLLEAFSLPLVHAFLQATSLDIPTHTYHGFSFSADMVILSVVEKTELVCALVSLLSFCFKVLVSVYVCMRACVHLHVCVCFFMLVRAQGCHSVVCHSIHGAQKTTLGVGPCPLSHLRQCLFVINTCVAG